MSKWRELEKEFRELSAHLQFMRADVQWDDSGKEIWRLAAITGKNFEIRFLALTKIAGNYIKSLSHHNSEVMSELIAEPDPVIRWYKAIWKLSNNFDYRFTGAEKDESGNIGRYIHVGSIHNIVDASSILCLELDAHEKSTLFSGANGYGIKGILFKLRKRYTCMMP